MKNETIKFVCDECGKECKETNFYRSLDFCSKDCDIKFTIKLIKEIDEKNMKEELINIEKEWNKKYGK